MALSLLHANDKLGVHAPSWYSATANTTTAYPALKGEHRYDVCIVGGGYSGLSSALHLAKKGYSVCVLEAHRLGWGASGRNGGQVASGQRQDQDFLEKLVGNDLAHRAFDIGVEAASLVSELIDTHDIKCDYKAGIIEANHRSRYDGEAKEYVEKLANEYRYDAVQYLEPKELANKVGSPDYSGGTLDAASGHLHPLNYALGLASTAEKAGATLHELSEVSSITDSGDKKSVATDIGSVQADTVILACNGYQTGLGGTAETRIMPINNFILATEPLSDELANSLIRDREAVADSRFVVNYFRLSNDNRMLFGGGENYGYRFPKDIKAFVRPKMLKIFPQLTDAKVDYGWGGTLGITVNRMPCFQFENNVMMIAGYSGSGVAMATMAGKIAAEAISGQMSSFDVMRTMPTPKFPGGKILRWPTLAAAMTWFSLMDRL